MMRSYVLALIIPALGLASGCGDSSTGPAPITIEQDKAQSVLIDKTGKRWNVTDAKRHYGFDPEKFQFGLGPNAIPPILNAEMLSPGELGYPNDLQDFIVLGANLNGNIRAYPLYILKFYEVADEKFGDDHVAVAY